MDLEKIIEFNRPFAYFVVDAKKNLVMLSGVLKAPQETLNFM